MGMDISKLSHLEKLKRQKELIEVRIKKAEARHKQQERKSDTRRKILLGAYFLEKFKNEGTLDSIKAELDKFLTRNSDRALFGLHSLKDETM